MKRWSLVAILGLASACAGLDHRNARAPCPLSRDTAAQLEQFKTINVESPCAAAETCSDGPYACTCDVARGGAPRPNRWLCRRTRAKPDGCPDDDALIGGASCSIERQECEAPVACGCFASTTATCQQGHWVLPECERCLAP